MMPYYGYGMFYDPTYILVFIGVILCMGASAKVNSTFNKYSKYASQSGYTGSTIARKILNDNELHQISIQHVRGSLSDHFDPRNFTVNLSDTVYDSGSIAAIAVAAHECGHVLQHKNNYFPYNLRHLLVPIANIGSNISWFLIIIGLFLGYSANASYPGVGGTLVEIGVLCFSMAVLFQIVTLPVEFNASKRALRILTASNRFSADELYAARKVLSAAALTYVAGAASSILQLIRILLIVNRRRD